MDRYWFGGGLRRGMLLAAVLLPSCVVAVDVGQVLASRIRRGPDARAQPLDIGLFICGRTKAAECQVIRLMGHVVPDSEEPPDFEEIGPSDAIRAVDSTAEMLLDTTTLPPPDATTAMLMAEVSRSPASELPPAGWRILDLPDNPPPQVEGGGDSSSSVSSQHENHEEEEEEEERGVVMSASSWLGRRPWALFVLGASSLFSLAALFALVHAALGGGGAPHLLPAALQLSSVPCLCAGAALHALPPLLGAAVRGAATDGALALCYGGLLIRGMQLRAQGVSSRVDQLLTFVLAVSVSGALQSRGEVASRLYGGALLGAAVAYACASTRGGTGRRALLCSALCCGLLLGVWAAARRLLSAEGASRDAALLLLSTALAVLGGMPWRGGMLGRKQQLLHPYATDTLSSVFTLSSATSSKGGRGRTKTLERTGGGELYAYP